MIFTTMTMQTTCRYRQEYTVNFDYGAKTAEHSAGVEPPLIAELGFYIASYNWDYSREQAPSSWSGDFIYLQLFLNHHDMIDIQYAESFSASEGMVFAPT